MKHPSPIVFSLAGLLLALGLARSLSAANEPDVERGESIPAVIAKLGEPEGQFQQGGILTFYYSRGRVDFTDGIVVKSSLVSSDEARQIRQTRERGAADQRQRAQVEQDRLTRAGAIELTKRLQDKSFAAQPAEARLAAWQDFSRQYPYTDVAAPITSVLKEVEGIQQKRRAQEEIPRIDQRLAEIQARFIQLDKDYAASLAHWKRNEITAERRKLSAEQADLKNRRGILSPPPEP
jgi:hypothetical protein